MDGGVHAENSSRSSVAMLGEIERMDMRAAENARERPSSKENLGQGHEAVSFPAESR